ncbi:Ig-like domain-containing protein [Paucibacter sp. O1-1]|nr:Ig-like domain-containing protein [Paucibacter sp. O1-1]MDA3830828.1 Ig-like domain-containing protein [Paucibacter sp. O1-1]
MQLGTTIRALFLSLASILLFTGCNGASDDSDSDTSDDSYSLSVSYQDVVNGQCDASTDSLVFDLNDSVCAVATLTLGNASVSGALIEFSTSNATLSNASVLTDTSGIATTFITSTSTEAGTLAAAYTSDDDDSVSDTRNYQFKEYSTLAPAEALNFTVSISDSSGVITRFNVGMSTVQLNATLTDSEKPGHSQSNCDL